MQLPVVCCHSMLPVVNSLLSSCLITLESVHRTCEENLWYERLPLALVPRFYIETVVVTDWISAVSFSIKITANLSRQMRLLS